MLTQLHAKRILCFGDSNTWGQRPERKGRYTVDERWTALLQRHLGTDFDVIEEGLASRTTNLDYSRKPGRNGKTYLLPCLQSQNPLDAVVLMIGTSDYKIEFGPRQPAELAAAIKELIAAIRQYGAGESGHAPHILVVSPIYINGDAPGFAELYAGTYYNQTSITVSRTVAPELARMAVQEGCAFFDAATCAQPGEDGIHMTLQGHAALAAALVAKIKELLA